MLGTPGRSEEGIRFPTGRVTEGCELPGELWELNSGPLQEQQVLIAAEPSVCPEPSVILLTQGRLRIRQVQVYISSSRAKASLRKGPWVSNARKIWLS